MRDSPHRDPRNLSELLKENILTGDPFRTKKAELLARL